MRSWQITAFGEPRDVAGVVEVADPEPGPGEVVVAPRFAGLAFADTVMCRGLYQDRPELPYAPGFELSGVVHAAGVGVDLTPGTRVLAIPDLPPGRRGALSELVALPAGNAVVLPGSVPFDLAAALPNNYVTAHLALHRRGRLRRGETVLVHGAAGGVGSAAVELAVAAGARVVAAVSGEEKARLCRDLGAHVVVDYTKQDFVGTVLETTGGRGADVVVDPVGGRAFERSRRCIAVEGRLLVIGFPAGIGTIRANHPLLRSYSVVGVNRDVHRRLQPDVHRAAQLDVLDLCSAGALRPVVQEIGFDEVLDGWDLIEARKVLGKLVVRVSGDDHSLRGG
ncbi:MAG: alcohol dehydrogenase [Amycolatopsis sp.]|uniref:NADPH:quinone oxidoreductase family protein n=1 Tax=Amycolatopsis sp. TaxID=37632 RepID=UPI0026311EB6|nr:NADPH:quinone oxidoreductase family protein [Amycolatopsis sp.]MCU1679555.1 alcohol dehydrogenase [Amycolatopsis sp.]